MKSVLIKTTMDGAKVPSYSSANAAGADLFATEQVTISPGRIALVKTGIILSFENGYEVQIRSRSGLVKNHGIAVANSPGTIDSDYRGEIGVLLINHSDIPYTVNRGDKIAQMVLAKHEVCDFLLVDEILETERGTCGFGSTGK